jgi:Dyggve-Melchior-Clausen syndrome protein.
VEVLRLLLAACCDPLYSPAEDYNPLASRWLSVATAVDAPNAICLFYSLLNTIVTYDPKQGIGGAFAIDTHAKVVGLSAQLLCVLLDCGLPGNPESTQNEDEEEIIDFEEAAATGFNVFRTTLARITSGRELSLIYDGLTRLLANVYESGNTLAPGSVKGIQCYQEILVLFWKILDENPLFMDHIMTKCDTTKIVVPVCYILYQSRRDPTRIGLVHICTFLLLKLSGERSFAVSLNKPYTTRLPCDLPLFTGGHADLISITFHKLVVNGSIKLVPLYSCFLTIICNISPYWRKMSLVAAVKLVNLFELLASPKFLFSDYKAYQHLAQILEIFNNIIQYQYHDNQHLVYAIIRRKDTFGRLSTMSLDRAISLYNQAYGDRTTKAKEEIRKRIVSVKRVDEQGKDMIAMDDSDEDDIVGRNFEPTESWLSEFKDKMPFETISRLLQHLIPVIDDVIEKADGVVDEKFILDVLKDVTMVGLLPVPHPIVIRKYQPNQYTTLWFTAYLWGVIYVNHQSLPIFDGKAIKLFRVSINGSEKDEDYDEDDDFDGEDDDYE